MTPRQFLKTSDRVQRLFLWGYSRLHHMDKHLVKAAMGTVTHQGSNRGSQSPRFR
jgi:hypothetical protein